MTKHDRTRELGPAIMKKTKSPHPRAFGDVDMNAEHGIFQIDARQGRLCRLTLIGHTERGFPRRELAAISSNVWKEIFVAVQNELIRGMEGRGDNKDGPKLVDGENALSPLMVRELSVLLWAIMEDEDNTQTDALLAGWKQLACEERWWLYARASSTAQKKGQGWRRALYYALNDPANTRTMVRPVASHTKRASKKKSPARRLTQSSGSSGMSKRKRATETSSMKPLTSENSEKIIKKKPKTKMKSSQAKSIPKKSA